MHEEENNKKKFIEIIPYQSRWQAEFKLIGSILRQGLGSLALRIDHIGYTAVQGLAAKDIIDIQVTVITLNQECQVAMQALGFRQVEEVQRDHIPPLVGCDEIEWEKWYFKSPVDQRKSHTHMRVQGRANQRYPLLFRDYLRTHAATAKAYAELKRQLAQNLADLETYSDVKDPVVDLIYLAAEEWATATHWEPGPSDV